MPTVCATCHEDLDVIVWRVVDGLLVSPAPTTSSDRHFAQMFYGDVMDLGERQERSALYFMSQLLLLVEYGFIPAFLIRFACVYAEEHF